MNDIPRDDVIYYLTIVSTVLITLTLVAYCIREFIWPWLRRRKLKHPIDAWFVITSKDRFDVKYAVQDQEREHNTKLLVLPSHTDDLLLHILWRNRFAFTQHHLVMSFDGNRKEKPLIDHFFHPFVKIGAATKRPGEYQGHYIDYHDNYHIDEVRHRAFHQMITYGFKIGTREPGQYKFTICIVADGVDGEVSLPVLVEDKPATVMRCKKHWFCKVRPRPIEVVDSSDPTLAQPPTPAP
jgi:hypothetical protein